MARKRLGIVSLAMLTILAASAAAQQSNQIAGIIGRSFISNQSVTGTSLTNPNVHFGDGLSYEGNVSHSFFNFGIAGLSVELPFVYNPSTNVQFGLNTVPKDFRAYFLTPAARVNFFPGTAFSPWASVGAGFASFSPSNTLEFGGVNAVKSTTSAVFEVGGGLDVRVSDHFKIRGEVRDFNTHEPPINLNSGNRYNHVFMGVGVVFGF
jgi:opacity protein-like surface antigen